MKLKTLVTGGTGFVGRRLVKRLIDDGYEVTITSGGIGPHPEGVRVLYRGLSGIDKIDLFGYDVVFHQLANNDTRCQDESEMFRVNLYDSIELFSKAVTGGCKTFVYASSTAVYGAEPAPYVEGLTPVKPLNVYGESKAEFDVWAMEFAKSHSVQVTGLRYCNVYGPGEGHKGKRMSMIGQIIRRMKTGHPPKLFTNGEQKRDWVYVDDVVEMNLLAMFRGAGGLGEIYNCGSGTASTFNEIVKVVNYLTYQGVVPEYIACPFEAEYQSFTQCDIEKARRDLGYSPGFDLRSGIEAYLKEFNASERSPS